MTYKLIAKLAGKDILVDPLQASGANIVLPDVPCEASVYVKAAVIMQVSGIAKNAIADSLSNSNVIGIVEAKGDLSHCDIRVLGITADIFSGLDVTKEYYLSDGVAGAITNIPPTASGSVLLKLGQPFSADEFLVSKGQSTVRL